MQRPLARLHTRAACTVISHSRTVSRPKQHGCSVFLNNPRENPFSQTLPLSFFQLPVAARSGSLFFQLPVIFIWVVYTFQSLDSVEVGVSGIRTHRSRGATLGGFSAEKVPVERKLDPITRTYPPCYSLYSTVYRPSLEFTRTATGITAGLRWNGAAGGRLRSCRT